MISCGTGQQLNPWSGKSIARGRILCVGALLFRAGDAKDNRFTVRRISFAKRLAVLRWVVPTLLLFATATVAETWRVHDGGDLNARMGPGTGHPIITTLQQFPITFKLSGPAPNLGVRHGSVVAGARWGHSNTIQAAAWLVKLR